ncbi:hypothetical protein [Pedobacter sp. NJ-S-72]
MNIQIIKLPAIPVYAGLIFKGLKPHLLFLFLIFMWCLAPPWLRIFDETAGNIDQSIWLLVLLSLISFLLVAGLCWWLLQRVWQIIGLPLLSDMVSQFKTLTSWQQLSFYWASFVSLLLAASVCLTAIC